MRASKKATLRYGSPGLAPEERDTIQVGLAGAVSSKATKFRNLHSACRTPISEQKRCAECDEVLTEPDGLLKGFEITKDEFVVFTEDELKDAIPERDPFIDITKFVPRGELSGLMIDKEYFLIPDKIAPGRYGVLFQSMSGLKVTGLGKQTLWGKEHPCAVYPNQTFESGGVLMMAILHPHEDLVEPDFASPTPTREGVRDGRTKIEALLGHLEPEDLEVESRTQINALIASRLEHPAVTPAPDLVAQLKETVKRQRKPAVKK
jgi:DNA end-binding protein Ku